MLGHGQNGFETKLLNGDVAQRTIEDSIVLSTANEIEESYKKHHKAKMGLKSTIEDIKKRQKSVNMVLPANNNNNYHGRSLSNVSSAIKLKPLDINQTYSISAKKGKIMNHYYPNHSGQ